MYFNALLVSAADGWGSNYVRSHKACGWHTALIPIREHDPQNLARRTIPKHSAGSRLSAGSFTKIENIGNVTSVISYYKKDSSRIINK